MAYLFTSESVSEGHPDKIADQISDALIDNFLAFDPESKVACETLVTTGQVILAGEVKSKTYLDVQQIARDVIKKIGYTKSEYMFEANSCGILSAIHEQSADINQGVDRSAHFSATLISSNNHLSPDIPPAGCVLIITNAMYTFCPTKAFKLITFSSY